MLQEVKRKFHWQQYQGDESLTNTMAIQMKTNKIVYYSTVVYSIVLVQYSTIQYYTVIYFKIRLSQQFKKMLWSAVVWHMSATWQPPNLIWPIILWNSFRKTWKLPHLPHSPDLAQAIFISLAPKDTTVWISIQIRWEGRGGGERLAGRTTKRLLPRNFCCNGMLEEVYGMWWGWWGLHGKLTSLYCIYICNKSLCTFFSVSFEWLVICKIPMWQPLKIC